MGKITEVYYEEVDPKKSNPQEAGEFYFYHNLLNIDNEFQRKYESIEEYQINLRNSLIHAAIANKKIPERIKLNNAIFGISSLKGKSILIVEY